MFDEAEWAVIGPALAQALGAVQAYRAEHACGLAEARAAVQQRVLALHAELTGHRETDFETIRHHRLADFGPACAQCGELLRTPAATFCAACGAPRRT